MTSYDNEQKGMDIAQSYQRKGSVLQTLGWVLLVFATIPAVWIWAGFRVGSYFWLYWVLGEGVLACSLLIAGTILRSKAARHFARFAPSIVAPSEYEAEQARQRDSGSQAA